MRLTKIQNVFLSHCVEWLVHAKAPSFILSMFSREYGNNWNKGKERLFFFFFWDLVYLFLITVLSDLLLQASVCIWVTFFKVCYIYFQNNFSVIVQEENICPSYFLQTVEIGTFMLQIRWTHHRSRLYGPGMCSRHLITRFVHFHDSACAALIIC